MSFFANVRFVASAHEPHELPPDVGTEVAFAGRSNAGKSSAINALTRRRRLAFVSKTPGRTQMINFFECAPNRRLVDLPGYGYAAVPQHERAHWGTLVSAYLADRSSLRGLVLIADARRGLTALDEQLLGWYSPAGQPVLVLLTKSDKLSRPAAQVALTAAAERLAAGFPGAGVELFSSISGVGVTAVQRVIHGWLK